MAQPKKENQYLVVGFSDKEENSLDDAFQNLAVNDKVEVKNDGDTTQEDGAPTVGPGKVADKNEDGNDASNMTFSAIITAIKTGNITPQMRTMLQGMGIDLPPGLDEETRKAVLDGKPSIEAICANLKAGKYKNVIIMSGAGLSTAAGIPDFRSPVKGLYATIAKKYKSLSQPEDVFTLSFFRRNPEPFWRLCRELDLFGTKSTYKPTVAHYLSKLLDEKGILLRTFTQNIDALDRRTGLREEKIMEAHGSAHGAYCIRCGIDQCLERIQREVEKEETPLCVKETCGGLVKPKITFFGESLPPRFSNLTREDFPKCDLLIVMGTSLAVAPFCHLVSDVSETTPRLLINLGDVMISSFRFNQPENYRDVFEKTTCDAGVERLVDLCGWTEEFKKILECGPVKLTEAAVDNVKVEVKIDLGNK